MFLLLLLLLLLLLTISPFTRATPPTCYTATGLPAPNDVPCLPSTSAQHSSAAPTSICSANDLCILPPTGTAHRGSCTDRTWGRACPHFCLSEHSGDDGLTGVNMTLCSTDRESTTYCCNDWTGRRCDCSEKDTPRVVLSLFDPVATIAAEPERAAHALTLGDIPWNTVGPVLVAVMTLCVLGMLLYVARMTYLANGTKDQTRSPSFAEHGRRFSDCFWSAALEEKARGNSKFSTGTVDTDDTDDNDAEKLRKGSNKSVRFSVGRRSLSEGSGSVLPTARTGTEVTGPPVIRTDIFAKRPSRPSLVGALPTVKSLSKLAVVGRPTFKRQDTNFGVVSDGMRGEVAGGEDGEGVKSVVSGLREPRD